MSVNPEQQALEEKRQQINRLIEEIARLAESPLGPGEFGAEFLQRLLLALAAPAGALWTRTAQGNLQQLYQVNFADLGLERIEGAKACHDELLRQVMLQPRPMQIPPRSGPAMVDGQNAPANLTGYILLLVPILVDRQPFGAIEIVLDPNRNPQAIRGFLQFLADMADYAGTYFKNTQFRAVLSQQQVWTQIEAFSRQVHQSLHLRETAYVAVNESRRLLEVDRVCVASRLGGYTEVEAISGADVIEKRSSLVQAMRALFDAVIVWNDRLIYSGTKDESLPPKVLDALDKYLAESQSKLLIIQPLRDERETDKDRPVRSAILVECFEPNFSAEALLGKLEVLAKHVTPALWNALEHRRIPMQWLLKPIADVRDTLRGQRLLWALASVAAAAVLVLAMIFVPYPLRMDAKGNLLPKERQTVYAQVAGKVNMKVKAGDPVKRGQELLTIDDPEMRSRINKLNGDIAFAKRRYEFLSSEITRATTDEQRQQMRVEMIKLKSDEEKAQGELKILIEQAGNPQFVVVTAPLEGVVVTFDTQELQNRIVQPRDKLLQVARVDGPWETELYIPEMHIGHVREAIARAPQRTLDVDIRLSSHPDRRFYGKLRDTGLGGEVIVHHNETVLKARVEIGDELRALLKELQGGAMPVETEVRAKVRCGNHPIGYVFLYQLWEFFFEHVLF